MLCGKLAERDLLAAPRRNFEIRQKPRDRRVEGHASGEHGLGRGACR